MARWCARVGALVLIAVGLGSVPAAALGPPVRWIRPVDGPVVRGFVAPRTPYGPGHRGVDFAVPPGTPVVAAGPGTVVFAGRVGSSSHVVVLHPASGWRTGYSFLATVAVRRGQSVVAGTVVGTTGGVGDGYDGTVLHFSLRIGDEYVDPMILFQPIDLAAAVHLAPTASDGSGMGYATPEPYRFERAAVVTGLRDRARAAPFAGPPSIRMPALWFP